MDAVHLLSLVSFLAASVKLGLGAYVIRSNPRAALNRTFFVTCASLALWSLGYTFLPDAASKSEAWFWFRVSAVGWTLSPSLVLHFLILLAHRENLLLRRGAYLALYGPGVYFLLRAWGGEMGVVDFVDTRFGWSDVYGPLSLGYALYLTFFKAYTAFGLWLLYRQSRHSELISERRQGRVIVLAGLPVLSGVALSGIYLPWMGVRNPPEIAHLIVVLWLLVIWSAVSKYKLMVMSPAAVAPNVLSTIADAVVVLGRDQTVVTCNTAAERLFGASGRRLEGLTLPELLSEHDPRSAADVEFFLRREARNVEMTYQRRGGEEIVLQVSSSEVKDACGQAMGQVLVLRDVSSEKKAEAGLRHLATHDPLTSLPNRSLLQDRLERALTRAQRLSGRFGVMMFDLDEFKQINDEIDHETGDLVLQHTARRLTHCVRGLDTVCRLGGDEFLVIVEDLKELEDADVVARRILQAFSTPIMARGRTLSVLGSLGISMFPTDGSDVETLVKKADLALQSAKQKGRGQHQFFSREMEVSNRERARIERGLQRALGRRELFLVYQPLFDLATGDIAGIEALLRWQSPELGLVSPMRFIPLAERTGQIVPIGEWVLHTACRQNRRWQQQGLPSVAVGVNVSARQLREENFVSMVARALRETELPAHCLELELTESATMAELEHPVETLTRLSRLGVRLVIDDFGTGYSSLARLRRLPIQGIKVDRSFIENIVDDDRARSLVLAIGAMARNLDLQVVAEGIETVDQLRALSCMEEAPAMFRCDRVQGFLFSRPLRAQELSPLLRQSPTEGESLYCVRRLLGDSVA